MPLVRKLTRGFCCVVHSKNVSFTNSLLSDPCRNNKIRVGHNEGYKSIWEISFPDFFCL